MTKRFYAAVKPDKIVCFSCQTEFPFTDEFFFVKKASRYGLNYKCKTCDVERRAKQKKELGGSVENEVYRVVKNKALLKKIIALRNSGTCEICGDSGSVDEGTTMVIDHCHEKKELRGILCNRCNSGIGYFEDNPELLRQAAKYIEKTERPIIQLVKGA